MPWTIEPSSTFIKKQKQFVKSRPRELNAALGHVVDYVAELDAGAKPLNIRHGWLHDERQGLYAADQKGAKGQGLTQIRLYFFPDAVNQVLWLLSVGEKKTQKRDIQDCRDMAAGLERLKGDSNAGEAGAGPPDDDGTLPERGRDGA